MMKSRALLLVGVVLVGVGALAILASALPMNDSAEFIIPSGDYYYRFESTRLLNGKIEGSFETDAGQHVRVFVFSESQFKDYSTGGLAEFIYSAEDASGTFSGKISGMGRIYLVFEHASSTAETTVQMSYTVTGIAVNYMVAGIALVAVGITLAIVFARRKMAEAKAWPTSTVATDVTLFKDEKPPT